MKRYVLVVLLCSMVLFWCTKKTSDTVDINSINDLTTLQVVITQISEEMNAGKVSIDQAQKKLNQLQQKYIDLTMVAPGQKKIETQFETMEKLFETYPNASYDLPLWAKKLGMIKPEWMQFSKDLSKHSSNDSGYNSTTLVYKWTYTIALQQAQRIAKQAHLYVSKEFKKAQALVQSGDLQYISGLDIDTLASWVVYVNHELLTTNVDEFLSVSVDQDWTLIIETTKIK